MSTAAQIAANQMNAERSTGPRTPIGKAIASRNNFRHGFTGAFVILSWENAEEFHGLLLDLQVEHQPSTPTEHLLVQKMAQSWWLRQRAERLQGLCFHSELPTCHPQFEKDLALYIRYQTTHDRAFHKALQELLKLRAETRKAEIGFESRKRSQAAETRKEANENRRQELHTLRVAVAATRLRGQELKNSLLENPKTRINAGDVVERTAQAAA